jgi:hypothetical protein
MTRGSPLNAQGVPHDVLKLAARESAVGDLQIAEASKRGDGQRSSCAG